MKIYTTYFWKVRQLPEGVVPISICAKAPDDFTGAQYKKLAPKWDILQKYKHDGDKESYANSYLNTILGKLDHDEVLDDLWRLSQGNDIALVCYEKSGDFCHRHLAGKWLSEDVTEF